MNVAQHGIAKNVPGNEACHIASDVSALEFGILETYCCERGRLTARKRQSRDRHAGSPRTLRRRFRFNVPGCSLMTIAASWCFHMKRLAR